MEFWNSLDKFVTTYLHLCFNTFSLRYIRFVVLVAYGTRNHVVGHLFVYDFEMWCEGRCQAVDSDTSGTSPGDTHCLSVHEKAVSRIGPVLQGWWISPGAITSVTILRRNVLSRCFFFGFERTTLFYLKTGDFCLHLVDTDWAIANIFKSSPLTPQ